MMIDQTSYQFVYDLMKLGEESAVCSLVGRVFDEFNAKQYSEEGIRGFYHYINPSMLIRRSQANHFVCTAKTEKRMVGMIEVKAYAHISLLFVDRQFHGRGVGRNLIRTALLKCRNKKPDVENISVNSSPFAVPIYEKFGFCIMGPDRTENGIYFTPMVLDINETQLID